MTDAKGGSQVLDYETGRWRRAAVEVRDKKMIFKISDRVERAQHLLEQLPIEGELRHSLWCGQACSLRLPADFSRPFDFATKSDGVVTSIYPGWLAMYVPLPDATDGEGAELLISYGDAEARGSRGRQYVRLLGRLDEQRTSLTELASALAALERSGRQPVRITALTS